MREPEPPTEATPQHLFPTVVVQAPPEANKPLAATATLPELVALADQQQQGLESPLASIVMRSRSVGARVPVRSAELIELPPREPAGVTIRADDALITAITIASPCAKRKREPETAAKASANGKRSRATTSAKPVGDTTVVATRRSKRDVKAPRVLNL